MKLTKYAHACIVLEEQGRKLIIDPGGFTEDIGDVKSAMAVVVTHMHGDHFNPDHLDAIVAANPDVQLFSTSEVAAKYNKIAVKVVKAGDTATVGPFSLRFGGSMHADIHSTMPTPENTTLLVNDSFYYTGDSYVEPDKPVTVLAVTANAPWMKVGDSIDFIAKVKPKQCIPTHDGLLSEVGHMVYYGGLQAACENNGVTFVPLAPGESIEI